MHLIARVSYPDISRWLLNERTQVDQFILLSFDYGLDSEIAIGVIQQNVRLDVDSDAASAS